MNILLLCSGGFSTSILVDNMMEAGGNQNHIEAHPASDVEELVDDYDVVLVGPQIRFRYNKIEKTVLEHGKKVALISSQQYSRMDGKEMLELAEKTLKGE